MGISDTAIFIIEQLTITVSIGGARCKGVDVTIERFMHFLLRGPLSRLIGVDLAKCKTFSLQAYENNNLFNGIKKGECT